MKTCDKREIQAADNTLDTALNSLLKHKEALLNNGITKEQLKRTFVEMARLHLDLSVLRKKAGFEAFEDDYRTLKGEIEDE